MLIHSGTETVLLKLKNAEQVLASVSTAKSVIETGDHQIVMVPHRLDELKVLRNLGVRVPSPILYNYDWPGRFKPFDHQRQTAAFLTAHNRCLVLNEIGTGKTQSALWAADYLMREGYVSKVLIISPLSTLERVWADAIFTGFPDRDFVVLHGAAKKRLNLLSKDVDFYVINHDGFSIIAEQARRMFDLIIVDEAAVLRNPSTNRYRKFSKWLREEKDVLLWLMTGTPTPNAPTDAWALAKLVGSPYLTESYGAFRNQVMNRISEHVFIPRPESVETVRHILQPAIRYTRDECFDLPETITQTRTADLTPEQVKYYDKMFRSLVVELASGTISAVNQAVKAQKLVQIACGVAYDDDGNHVNLDCTPRVKLLKELIREAGEKVIVFVPLTGVLEMLNRELTADKFTVGVVNGEVSAAKRNVIFRSFQEENNPQVLVAHPGTMSHGLTLTSASTIIWYGPIYSNEQYTQANGRIERIGKKKVSNVIHIEGTALEHKMFERLKNKQQIQGVLLDLIQKMR